MSKASKPPITLRLQVLAAVDYAPGATIRDRIKHVACRTFTDAERGIDYRFTWRTISTWLYRFKKRGMATLDNAPRADRGLPRKVSVAQLAEAIREVLPSLSHNKQGQLPRSVLYRRLLEKGLFTRRQLAPTTFYRRLREHRLLDDPHTRERLRLSFAMPYANDLWQADTLHGPSIRTPDGGWRKTFLVAFLDDASRVVAHAEFFYHDDTASMVEAFRSALFKRGRPQRLYFDNGSNYRSTVILQAARDDSGAHGRPATPMVEKSPRLVLLTTASTCCSVMSPSTTCTLTSRRRGASTMPDRPCGRPAGGR